MTAAKKTMNKSGRIVHDGILPLGERVRAYVEENFRLIAALVLVLCAVIAGTSLWMITRSRAESEASLRLYAALNIMVQQGEKAAEREIGFNRALESFQGIIRDYASTHAGVMAHFYAGVCSYNLKRYDDAITFYEGFIKKSGPTDAFFLPAAYEGIGYAYESKGNVNEALANFTEQQKLGVAPSNALALMNLARSHEAAGDLQAACTAYREFVRAHPSSAFKDVAGAKIAALCDPESPSAQAAQPVD